MVSYTVLSHQDPDQHFIYWARLFKVLSPNYDDTVENIATGLKRALGRNHKTFAKLGITSKLPPEYIVALEESDVVGYGHIQYHITDDLPQECYAFVFVHPDHRRRGIGTALLQKLQESCKGTSVQKLFSFVEKNDDRDFALTCGATVTEESVTYRWKLTEDHGGELDDDVIILQNPKPDQLQEFITVYNLAKRDEPGSFTPTIWKAEDFVETQNAKVEGIIVGYLTYDDRIVAVTDVAIPRVKSMIMQRFTGTHPQYRGRGFATRLKANMIRYITNTHRDRLPLILESSTLVENVGMQRVYEKLGASVTGKEITLEIDCPPF